MADQSLPEIDEAACLRTLQDLIAIDSRTLTEGESKASEYMAKAMKSIGLDAKIHPFGDGSRQNAIGQWGDGTGPTLLFNGHLDTNPISEGWTVDPWEAQVIDDHVYGIGVSNMKSGCASYFCAVKTLVQAGYRPKGTVKLTYVVGELQGGPGTQALIADGLCGADYFINCEPTDVKAITMHAQAVKFQIELFGVTRHMSKSNEATDVIMAASYLVPLLNELSYEGSLSDEHLRCNKTHVGVLKAALGRDLSESRPPQVADYAVIKGGVRVAPGQNVEHVLSGLNGACEKTRQKFPQLRYHVSEIPGQTLPSFEVAKDAEIVRHLNKAYKEVRGTDQPTGVFPPACYFGSDGGHLYQKLGMEGIVCGPGGKFNTMPDERVELVDYYDIIRMFIRVIADTVGIEKV